MTGGFFVIDRGVWDHPGFANETFTELQAWFWLISSAAWEPCQVRVGKSTIGLERGQCAFALRFLATKWRWSEPRVRRFLKRRASDAQVLVLATREATLITICKYNEYQLGRRTDVSENDAGLNQERRKEEEYNNLNNNNSIGGAEAPPNNVVPLSRQYAFEGRLVKLAQADLDRWRKSYSALPDIGATLQAADDYYSEHPPKDGKWFFPVSKWLEREHNATKAKATISEKEELRRRGDAW